MRKTFKVHLDDSEIDNLVSALDSYQQELERKTELAKEKIAKLISEEAKKNFSSAKGDYVSPIVKGTKLNFQFEPVSVNVTIGTSGNATVVVASGDDVAFIEFGAGVTFNGAAGTSPHPTGMFTIGSYGKGYGKHKMWEFTDGGKFKSRGTPAQMPLWNALEKIKPEIGQIISEVFQS